MEVTEMGRTAEDYLKVWRNWIGYSEANGKHREIVDLYNCTKPLPRNYKVSYQDAWCDVTVSAAAIKAGITDLIGRECGCEEHIKIFKEKGIWIEDGTITPKPGYLIVYNWNDTSQPNDGYADHIGVVEKVTGNAIVCIEGNRNHAVERRTISRGCGCIRGYAAPKYELSAPSGEEPPVNKGDLDKTVKRIGTVAVRDGGLNIRTWAGIEYPPCSFSPLVNGTKVFVCDTVKASDGALWYYIKYKERYGFAHFAYIK